jgi:DNA-binding GntR family transcriptional regulator
MAHSADVYQTIRLPIERLGLRDRVYDLILDMLLGGNAEAGGRLSIDELSRNLDVSQTPVREALVQLERTGLVIREAHRGYRVAPPLAPDQISKLFDARLIFEVGVIELVEPKARDLSPQLQVAQKLHSELATKLNAASKNGTIPVPLLRQCFEADWGFHRTILECTENPFILQMSEAVSTHLHRLRQLVLKGENDVEIAVEEHSAIADAFESGTPGAAAAAMRLHIVKVRERAMASFF